jgi:hypothetical protein
MRRIPVLLALLLAPLAAYAAEPQTPDWSQSIETVVATAHRGGPLIWRVARGNSAVYLLGVVQPLPKGLAWDDAGVRAVLRGARLLLLPPKASVGIFEGLWYLAWHSGDVYLPDSTPMESTLPPALRARFSALRKSIGRSEGRYAGLRPPLAGLRLEGDFLEAHRLEKDEPSETLRRIARGLGVPARPIADYPAIPMLKQLPVMSRAANEGCVKALLDDIDSISIHAGPAAHAWATGDLAALKATFSEQRFESCVQSLPSFAALVERSVSDSVKSIREGLARPGKTVVAVSVGTLLRRNGILDRLESDGLRVEQPGSWEPPPTPP